MKGIEAAALGGRFVAIGELKLRRGQQIEACLDLIEHARIRHYVENGDELLNIHGTSIVTHSLNSERTMERNLIPNPAESQAFPATATLLEQTS